MAVRIAEVPGVAAVEGVLRRLDDIGAGLVRLLDDLIDLLTADDIVPDRERGGADLRLGKTGIVDNVVLRPDSEL